MLVIDVIKLHASYVHEKIHKCTFHIFVHISNQTSPQDKNHYTLNASHVHHCKIMMKPFWAQNNVMSVEMTLWQIIVTVSLPFMDRSKQFRTQIQLFILIKKII